MPAEPKLPAGLEPAAQMDLTHEASLGQLDFAEVDLSGQEADSVEWRQCRFNRTSLAGGVLERATFTDCVVANSDWANLATSKATMLRVRFDSVRLTGLHWVDGALRSVLFNECRVDLAAFRFTTFKEVEFVDCSLVRADFTNADLRGARFTRCDLTGAQFAHVKAEGAAFRRCELAGVGNIESLRGATMSTADLPALSHVFAKALGITIEES